MHTLIAELERRLARWRTEHTQVAADAQAINLQRARFVAPAVAALGAVAALWLGVSLIAGHASDPVFEWKLALLLTHLLMALLFGLCAWAAHVLRFNTKSWPGRTLPLGMAALGLLFGVTFAAIDQWVTPNMTPFMLGAVAVGLLLCWRPSVSAGFYLAAYALFFETMGRDQPDVQVVLSNRINGLVAVVLAWAVSVVLWRNFTRLQLSQQQLAVVNAELQVRQKELQRLTRLDGLTGLYNRNTFVELTRLELARAQRQGSATSILLLDLDLFKHVNDTWGHPAGDAVLKNVSAVVNNSVRSTDLVGRLGGEEFIILLPNTPIDAARWLAEKVRASVERSPTAWNNGQIHSTVSIGVASTTAVENRDFDHLYSSADQALYSAKEKGRNRVES